MQREPLTMICYADISGQLRGKGFPRRLLPKRLAGGVGWTPTNIQIMALGGIADSPWGPRGDLLLLPDPATEVFLDFADGTAPEHFLLADVAETDRTPWSCCPRTLLKNVVAELRAAGLVPHVSFEHEFVYTGARSRPGDGYALDALRRHGPFGELFLSALHAAGLEPDSYLPEFGAGQFEVTLPPCAAVAAADRALILREAARATAWRLGHRAVFSPVVTEDGLGNGVHLHISLRDPRGRPVTHDAGGRAGLSPVMASFCAGIARFMPALCALTAPLPISYLRLRPNRWSAAWNNIGVQDREAALRVCPLPAAPEAAAEACNVEYRPADAAANPYLQLAVVLRAGLEGVRRSLPMPGPLAADPGTLAAEALEEAGVVRLPTSLDDALDRLMAEPAVLGWLPPALADLYLRHKRSELDATRGRTAAELCAMYAEVY